MVSLLESEPRDGDVGSLYTEVLTVGMTSPTNIPTLCYN